MAHRIQVEERSAEHIGVYETQISAIVNTSSSSFRITSSQPDCGTDRRR
jgi:hypothetical protein